MRAIKHGGWRLVRDDRPQQDQPRAPAAQARLGIDVACVAAIDQFASPALRQRPASLEPRVGIVSAGDDDRAKRELFNRCRAEVTQRARAVEAVDVRRRHQQRAG